MFLLTVCKRNVSPDLLNSPPVQLNSVSLSSAAFEFSKHNSETTQIKVFRNVQCNVSKHFKVSGICWEIQLTDGISGVVNEIPISPPLQQTGKNSTFENFNQVWNMSLPRDLWGHSSSQSSVKGFSSTWPIMILNVRACYLLSPLTTVGPLGSYTTGGWPWAIFSHLIV